MGGCGLCTNASLSPAPCLLHTLRSRAEQRVVQREGASGGGEGRGRSPRCALTGLTASPTPLAF